MSPADRAPNGPVAEWWLPPLSCFPELFCLVDGFSFCLHFKEYSACLCPCSLPLQWSLGEGEGRRESTEDRTKNMKTFLRIFYMNSLYNQNAAYPKHPVMKDTSKHMLLTPFLFWVRVWVDFPFAPQSLSRLQSAAAFLHLLSIPRNTKSSPVMTFVFPVFCALNALPPPSVSTSLTSFKSQLKYLLLSEPLSHH